MIVEILILSNVLHIFLEEGFMKLPTAMSIVLGSVLFVTLIALIATNILWCRLRQQYKIIKTEHDQIKQISLKTQASVDRSLPSVIIQEATDDETYEIPMTEDPELKQEAIKDSQATVPTTVSSPERKVSVSPYAYTTHSVTTDFTRASPIAADYVDMLSKKAEAGLSSEKY